jgi:hypothetical protein
MKKWRAWAIEARDRTGRRHLMLLAVMVVDGGVPSLELDFFPL